MPTERFLRLPTEKKEGIRMAALREFMRVPPEEASINRIIRDAGISRGSFYTYFEDKEELLGWLIEEQMEGHRQFYLKAIDDYRGDIWQVLEKSVEDSIKRAESSGIIQVLGNMIRSGCLSEYFQKCVNSGPERDRIMDEKNLRDFTYMYEHMDRSLCAVSKEEFFDLMEIHMMVLMLTLKRFFQHGLSEEKVMEYYRRHMRLVRYGACPGGQNLNK